MTEHAEYKIAGKTLNKLASSIRRKFNFDNKISPSDMPLYLTGSSNVFWVNEFNSANIHEAVGRIFTDFSKFNITAWNDHALFAPVEGTPNLFELTKRVNYRNASAQTLIYFSGIDVSNTYISTTSNNLKIQRPGVVETGVDNYIRINPIDSYDTLTGFNTTMSEGAVVAFTTTSAWTSSFPDYSYSLFLKHNGSNTYRVVGCLNSPIESGFGSASTNSSSYIAEITKSSPTGFVEGADLILCAHNATAHPILSNFTNSDEDSKFKVGTIYFDDLIDMTIPSGGFIYVINYGNNYQELYGDFTAIDYQNSGCAATWALMSNWLPGQQFIIENIDLENQTIPTTTPDLRWYEDGYICTSSITPLVASEIVIDGKPTESGWGKDGWIGVHLRNGTLQSAALNNDFNSDLNFLYNLKTDGEYLYFGIASTSEQSRDLQGTARLWIGDDDSSVYKYYIEASYTDGAFVYSLVKNTSTSTSAPETLVIGPADVLEAAYSIDENKYVVELKIKLSSIEVTTGFKYFVSLAISGDVLYTYLPIESTSRLYNFPYNNWHKDSAKTFIVIDEEINPEEALSLLSELL